MPDDMRDLAEQRGAQAVTLPGVLAQLYAAAATMKPGRNCREDISNAIAAVDAALGGANA